MSRRRPGPISLMKGEREGKLTCKHHELDAATTFDVSEAGLGAFLLDEVVVACHLRHLGSEGNEKFRC